MKMKTQKKSKSERSPPTDMDRWKIIRLIKDCEHSRNVGSLGRIGLHLTDVTSVNLLDLMRALSLELGREMADQYGANLHHAFIDSSLSTSVVDARHIIATYRAMTLATDAFHHPEMVLLKLLETYLIEGCNTKSWLLADIVNVATIAANDEEEEDTGWLLSDQIQQLTTESIITTDILLTALQRSPAVVQNFRHQLVSMLSDTDRLALLAADEDASLLAFRKQLNKILREKQKTFFTKRILHSVFSAWRKDLLLSKRLKGIRKREAFTDWLVAIKSIQATRLFTSTSHAFFCKSTALKAFRKLRRNARAMKKIKRCYTSEDEKNIHAGLGYIRLLLKSLLVRNAFEQWKTISSFENRLAEAQRWHARRVQRIVIRHFYLFTMSAIKTRKASRMASIQQEFVLQQINVNGSSGVTKLPASMMIKREKMKQHEEARQRQATLQKSIDANILQNQRAQRIQRETARRTHLEEEFSIAWSRKKVEAENACKERMKGWVLTTDFKEQSLKRQKEIHRCFSITHASTLDKVREEAIASPAVIRASILDAKLAQVGICWDEIEERLDNASSPISSKQFQSSLVSCGLLLSGSELEELFRSLVEYHDPAKSKDTSIELGKLKELQRLADLYLGKEGTRWKMYVNPIHRQLQLHNVFTGEKFIEKDIKKMDIRQLKSLIRGVWSPLLERCVNDNMQDEEIFQVRKAHYKERRNAHKAMIEFHAANCIQSLYRRNREKQLMKKQLWILDRRNLFQRRTKVVAAVLKLQRRFRQSRK
jgi:hypothetical protein